VLDALIPLSQPELLDTLTHRASTLVSPDKPTLVEAMIAPRAKTIK
jgi:ectoine hydroxylase-related dioxygenase (phytanoyl-CoA dioxygenase family)